MNNTFCLIDVTKMNKQNPRNYLVPSKEEIKNIRIGDLVRIVYKLENSLNNRFMDERVWVEIIEFKGTKFIGKFEGNGSQKTKLKKGDIISFEVNNITTVKRKEENIIDENKSVIITNKAIEHRQVNWIVRTTPLNKEDSGWQLFYGDEEYEYLDDSSNLIATSIKEVLNFEPLLEDIFLSRFDSAEYNSKLNKFIEV
ncbi:immunity protein Imm33 domain-containing protein [Clostridium cibarium]|uniref:DUF2185 domain-containing protein n=1 Tax=Clostridium cibarium TaxID=2762247 RepID=A0ABR8PYH5_9CLOT|nr:DUF2185 domain-containing protein [Clostridium cibarium]MBD7913214.1 DUF2185 domain-containing protein [Clostridium cibarium]